VTRAPRVLVSGVVLGQPPGGVRRHNAELLPRAARLLLAGGGALDLLEGRTPVALELGPEVRLLPSSVPAGPPAARARLEGAALRDALREAAAEGRPYDLVHTAHLPAPRRLGTPFTLTLHDLRALHLPSAPFVRRLLAGPLIGGAVRAAARVVAVSETVRAELLARFKLAPERVAVVPNAGDHLPLLPRAAAAGAPLLCLGHVERRKNLELLLRALALDPGLPDLLLAGAPKGGEELRLAALARELGVASRVRFLGAVADEELPALYASAACAVLPSRLEGFGIGVLEAQRARVPLAVADAGALPEIAGAGVPRFGVDDPAGCARAIRAALARPAAELAADARAAERYRWDASARRLVEVWTEAAGAL
jgi:glycosyltransferase involved in cell wall biosynthesis